MVRRQRRWVAGLVVLGVIFAQCITVAHACARATPESEKAPFAKAAVETMPSDCAAMAKQAAMNDNACQSHCAYGQQIDAQPDTPLAAVAPQPPLTVRVVASIVQFSLDTIFIRARSTAPPVSVLFSRFLI